MKVLDITYVALFAAIMGAMGLVPPIMLSFTPVPITLQTLGVLLAGDVTRIAFVLVWSVPIWSLYSQLVQGKNSARIALGIVTFPLGLLVILSRESKLYCLQRRKQS